MKVGDLVRIKDYKGNDIFIILRKADKYAIPVWVVQSNVTGYRFKMAADSLLPIGEGSPSA